MAAVGAVLALNAPADVSAARVQRPTVQYGSAVRSHAQVMQTSVYAAQRRYTSRYSFAPARFGYPGRLQCVPFARENSGIELTGNAHTWWDNADGIYERGARPEVGSVLSFRSNGRMRLGHVAVVSNVVSGRTIAIDHANWGGPGVGPGGIARNMTVVDVSEANDWSAVRVSLGNGDFGSVYPTDGFIYDRPDRGTMLANSGAGQAPAPLLAAPPRDLRPAAERMLVGLSPTAEVEVAEAPEDRLPRVRQVAQMSVYRPGGRGEVVRSARASYFMPAVRGAQYTSPARGTPSPSMVMVGLRTRAPVVREAPARTRAASPANVRRDAASVGAKRGRGGRT